MEKWRGERFTTKYLPMVRPFSAVPDLLRRVRDGGLKVAVASSAKKEELEIYLDIAGISQLVDESTSSTDAAKSKPAPDIFEVALKKLGIAATDAVAIGDTPYDAQAAGKAGMQTMGLLCGGFTEGSLRAGGCVAVYPGTWGIAGLLRRVAARSWDAARIIPRRGALAASLVVRI